MLTLRLASYSVHFHSYAEVHLSTYSLCYSAERWTLRSYHQRPIRNRI
jgi:hypothetical protein